MLYVKSHSFSASDLLDVIVEYFHNSLGRIPALHRLAKARIYWQLLSSDSIDWLKLQRSLKTGLLPLLGTIQSH